jgi:hypothetical protein
MTASRAGAFFGSVVVVVVVLVLVLPGAEVARAAEVTDVVAGVRVASPTCPIAPLPVPDFVEALRVELASRAPTSRAVLVTLAIEPCDVETKTVHVEAVDEASGRATARDVGLADVAPAARPRALSLAVAELVRGADAAASFAPVRPARASAAGSENKVARLPDGTPTPAAHGAFGVEALASLFPARATALWGGRLRLGLESPLGHSELFLEAVTGARHFDAGDVTVRSFGAGLSFGSNRRTGPVVLQPAFVAALGYAQIAGHAAAPDVTAASGAGLTVSLRLRLAVALPVILAWSVHAFAEGGFVARRFDALVDGSHAAGVAGPSIILGVGGAYASP